MTIAFGNKIALKTHARCIGVEAATWDMPVLLREAVPGSSDLFTIESVTGTPATSSDAILHYQEEFVLRAHDGRFLILHDHRVFAWQRYRETATRFSFHATGTGVTPEFGDSVHIMLASNGERISCASKPGSPVTIQPAPLDMGGGVFELIDGMGYVRTADTPARDFVALPEDDSEWIPEEELEQESDAGAPDAMSNESEPDEDFDDAAMTASQTLLPSKDDLLPAPSKDKVFPIPLGVVPDSERIKELKSMNDNLRYVIAAMEAARQREENLLRECAESSARCKDLEVNAEHLIALARNLDTLHARCNELEAGLGTDACAAENIEKKIITLISSWAEHLKPIKNTLSERLVETASAAVALEREILALQNEIDTNTKTIESHREKWGRLKPIHEAHVQANHKVLAALPGANAPADLLDQIEKLMKASDEALGEFIQSLEDTEKPKIVGFRPPVS